MPRMLPVYGLAVCRVRGEHLLYQGASDGSWGVESQGRFIGMRPSFFIIYVFHELFEPLIDMVFNIFGIRRNSPFHSVFPWTF